MDKIVITCFIKLFVTLKYNLFEVALSSKLPMSPGTHQGHSFHGGRAALPESTILIKSYETM